MLFKRNFCLQAAQSTQDSNVVWRWTLNTKDVCNQFSRSLIDAWMQKSAHTENGLNWVFVVFNNRNYYFLNVILPMCLRMFTQIWHRYKPMAYKLLTFPVMNYVAQNVCHYKWAWKLARIWLKIYYANTGRIII